MDVESTIDIVSAVLAGRDDARERLLERLRPRLVLWAAARLSPALAAKVEPDDVAQEILLAIHRDLDAFDGDDPKALLAWVFKIAEHRIRDLAAYHGAQKRRPTRAPDVVARTGAATAAAREETLARLRRAIAGLAEDRRLVLRLRRFQGLPVDEVARIMDRSPNAVRVLYCRAVKDLAATFGDRA